MKHLTLICTVVAAFTASLAVAQSDAHMADHADQWGMLESYCFDCHNSEDWAGGLAFDIMPPETVLEEAENWEATVRKLRGRQMPPPGSPQPEQEHIDNFVSWMEAALDSGSDGPRVGHVPVQRLNRTEYAIAVQGLLGVEINAEDYLPRDIEVDGFDNIAVALSVSPSFLEQYIAVARLVARLAVGEPVPKLANVYYPVTGGDQDAYEDGFPLGTRGGMLVKHNFPADGEYRFNILDLDVGLYPRSLETQHTLVLLVDGKEVFREKLGGEADLSLVNREGAPGRAEIMARFADIPAQLKAGAHDVVVTFIERSRAETDEPVGGFTPYGGFSFVGSLRVPRILDGIEVVGPLEPTGLSRTASRDRIFICEPQLADEERACAEQITANLAQRAFRRPVDLEDMESLMPFYEMGRQDPGGFDAGIEQVVAAVLASPDFLYRGISPIRDIGETQVYALSDLELASRLSFFLWSQGPDKELLDVAIANELNKPEVMKAQVRRMLDDPRAVSLVNNFALKWLNLDALDEIEPESGRFPEFSDQLRETFSEEVRLFIGSILLEDRPVLELLTASHTYLNEHLARHYGISSVHGAQFRRVTLEDEARWGLLGKSAVLLRTSYGDRTSPVLRGAWVLDKLMGTPPTPPPPNVETDLSVAEGEKPTTVRARLEQHRSKPGCNQCHGVIDPIGLALENFTVTGQWRDVDVLAQEVIDARTVLPSGAMINGPIELRRELTRRPDQFVQTLTEKLMLYGLGRELEYYDMPQVRAIVSAAAEDDYRLSAIVLGIVNSDAFRLQSRSHTEPAPVQVAALVSKTDDVPKN